MHILERLEQAGLIRPPGFVTGAAQYLTVMGSEAYGVSSNSSDQDVYGFCIPPKSIVFPKIIPGFESAQGFYCFVVFLEVAIKKVIDEHEFVIDGNGTF